MRKLLVGYGKSKLKTTAAYSSSRVSACVQKALRAEALIGFVSYFKHDFVNCWHDLSQDGSSNSISTSSSGSLTSFNRCVSIGARHKA